MIAHIAFVLWTTTIVAFLSPAIIAQFIGPAHITLKRMEKCGDDADGVKIEIGIKKINRTHQGIDVLVETEYEFGREIQLNGTAAKWGDGGWKPHILDMYDEDACNFFMKYAKDKFIDLLREKNQPERCPVKKGVYEVKNYVYDGNLSVPTMYGDFMVDVILSRLGKQMCCIKLFIRSDPKKP